LQPQQSKSKAAKKQHIAAAAAGGALAAIFFQMKQVIFLFILCFFAISSLSQNIKREMKAGEFTLQAHAVDPSLDKVFCEVGEMPVFPGGEDSLVSFARHNLYYPKSAIIDSVQGRVILQFSVDTTGQVYNEYVLMGVRLDLDAVCLSMLRKMPHWKAGRIEGQFVSVVFTSPIKFTLTK